PLPQDNPWDLLSVDYRCQVQGTAPVLEVRSHASDLSTTPPNAFWRAYFSVNAPNGVTERGQMFYVEVATDASATPAFHFGSVVRAQNGSYTLPPLGNATGGQISNATNEAVVRLALGTLNAFVTGPAVGPGSHLVGLKANTGTSGATA